MRFVTRPAPRVVGAATARPGGWPLLFIILFISVSPLFAGCGYRPVMPVTPGARGERVSIPLFSNLTPRFGVDRIMTEAFIRRFVSSGVRIEEASRSDLFLEGTVEEISFSSAARSAGDATTLTRLSGRVRVTISRSDGTKLDEQEFRDTVLLPFPERQPDRPVVEEAALRELADRVALKGLRALSRVVGEKGE